jgi:hypothetical protein
MRWARTLLVVLAAMLVLAPPASARKVVIGVGDQNGRFFENARFRGLGIHHARLIVPWDAIKYPWQVERLDKWLGDARRTGVVPLIVFGRSITEQYRTMLPSVADYTETLAAFRARYPWITEYATWNEPNHCNQPTCHDPEIVAAYYDVLRSQCTGCKVLGAAMLGVDGVNVWVKRFLAAAHSVPRYWGLHNYLDVNSYNRAATKAFLKAVKGDVWLTETAGIVSWRVDRHLPFRASARHALFATEWLFDWLLPVSPRIKRVYLYQWDFATGSAWDSALIAPSGRSRPALGVVRRALKHGVRRPRVNEKQLRRRWVRRHLGR